MIRKLFAPVLALVSLALVAGVACAGALSAEQKLLELRKAETGAGGPHRSEAERQRDIESAYAGLFNSAAQDGVRTQLDITQLRAMFEATHLVAF